MTPAARKPRSRAQRQRTDDKPPARERAAAAENRTDSTVDEYVPQATCLVPAEGDVDRPDLLEQDFTRADQDDIEACADWSYIYYFECAFEAMQVLSAGFQDGRFPLECQVAVDMDVWIYESFRRVPATQRRAMGASVLDGVEQMLDDLNDALLAIYEARVGCCDDEQTPPAGQAATLAWTIERLQRELSRRGAGAPAFFALRVGEELMQAFQILGSPDLARFLCPGYDIDLVGNIDRLLGDRKPDGSPRMPAYQLAELAVNSRQAIDQVAVLVESDLLELSMAEIDGLTARLALLRAVAGRRDFDGKRERLADDAAQTAAKVIQLTRTAGTGSAF
jgi:hypothetical protein